MIASIAAIAGGGALGAVLRHSVNQGALHYFGAGFPFGTIAVNIIGSFLMGVLISYFAHVWQPAPEAKAFLVTGLLGAFTTFSAFSLILSRFGSAVMKWPLLFMCWPLCFLQSAPCYWGWP